MPIAADTGRGLGGFNPPPLQCVAVRKRGSYWSPLPLLSSLDFSALNGVLHYTRCSQSSLVQGLKCMHRGWHCTVHYTSSAQCFLILQFAFCMFSTFAPPLQIIHNYDGKRAIKVCLSAALNSGAWLGFILTHKTASIELFWPLVGRRTPQRVDKPAVLTNYDFIIACLHMQQTQHKHLFWGGFSGYLIRPSPVLTFL